MFNVTSKYDKDKIVKEVFNSEKTQLVCSKHNYLGGKIPPKTSGCKECWFAYYIWDLATTPPGKRQERLDELEAVVRHAAEYAQTGKFGKDLELYEPGDLRFQVQFEKDAE